MIKDLLIHTGDPKTGTSSIQAVLHAHAWRCDSISLVPQQHINNAPLANALKEEAAPAFRRAQFSAIRDWFTTHDGDTGVISTEFLARRNPRRLQKALAEYFPGLPVRVISYVRPHASRVVSAYGQRLKTGTFDGTLEEFCRYITTVPTLYYAKRFPGWRETFGEGMILRPFIRSTLRDGDAVSDFLHLALRGESFERLPLETVNESLFAAELSGLRFIQKCFTRQELSNHHKLAIGGALQRKLAERPDRRGQKPALDRKSATHLATCFHQDAQTLDRDFFGAPLMQSELDQARDSPAETATDFTPAAHFSEAQRQRMGSLADQITARLTRLPTAWRHEYQISTGQRLPEDADPPSPKRQENARAVWAALDELADILSTPQSN